MIDYEIMPQEILSKAKGSLIAMSCGMDINLDDVERTVDQVQQYLPHDATIIFGAAFDDTLENEMQVYILVSGCNV